MVDAATSQASLTTGNHARSLPASRRQPRRQRLQGARPGRCLENSSASETTELESEEKRRVRERGVQEEGDETARTLSFRSRRKRRQVFSRMGGRVFSRTLWRKTKRKEARERQKMEQEDAQSQWCEAWSRLAKLRVLVPPITFGAGKLTCDVELDVKASASVDSCRLLSAGLLSGGQPCAELLWLLQWTGRHKALRLP